MKLIANILWIIFGGLMTAVLWATVGILFCITIIGIPIGIQFFKIAQYMLFPFGRKIVLNMGAVRFLLNVLWIIFIGIPLAVYSLVIGAALCMTIIGIPFGIKYFHFIKLALFPFGARII